MRLLDGAGFSGRVRALVFDGDLDPGRIAMLLDDTGTPEWDRLVTAGDWRNLVTNVGRAQMTKVIVGETTLHPLYMGLSTALVVPALADVALPSELYRGVLSVVQSFNTYYQRYSAYFSTVSFASTGIGGEALFDTASTGGSMWAEAAITVSKSATQSLVIEHKVQATT